MEGRIFCDRPNSRSIATLRPLSHFASKYKESSSMDNTEWGTHAQGMCSTPHKKSKKENLEGRNVGTKAKVPNMV